jgi:photosystem II stability/assembly factor-like uncharacterized protein
VGSLPTRKTVYAFAYNPQDTKVMYASLKEGLYLSRDKGEGWSYLENSPKDVVTIIVDPENPSRIFVGTAEGKVLLSEDAGRSWRLGNG